MNLELNHDLGLAFGLLLSVTLKSLLLLALASGLALTLRRASAATRHFLWLTASAGVVLLPLLALLPAWNTPAWAGPATRSVETLNQIALSVTGNAQTAPPPSVGTAASASDQMASNPNPVPSGKGHGSAYSALPGMLLGLWAIGVSVCLTRWIVGGLRLQRIAASAHPPEHAHWIELTTKLSGQLGLRCSVRLLVAKASLMPMTWGWQKPIVLLPAEAGTWPEDRLELVLRHELAHVRRRDYLTQTVAALACALQWFNPLVWFAAHRMQAERELACDDLVLSAGTQASTYAEHLLEIALQYRSRFAPASLPMARPGDLEQRLHAVVADNRNRGGLSLPTALCIATTTLLLVCFVGACAKSDAPNTTPEAGHPIPARIKTFFANREKLARALEAQAQKEDPDSYGAMPAFFWEFFESGTQGNWSAMTNVYNKLRRGGQQYGGTNTALRGPAFQCVTEAYGAYEPFNFAGEKYPEAFTRDILDSLPEQCVYFGGTDPGRFLITAAVTSRTNGDPFFVLTQNALADGTYLMYLRHLYADELYIPTRADSEVCFREYYTGAQKRWQEGKLKKGEQVVVSNGRVELSGTVAVMGINALLAKVIFDKNPDREFYIEESFPLDWMYPHLTPDGLILKVNRQPITNLDDEIIQRDQQYWASRITGMIGNWLNADTSVNEVCAFANRVFGAGNLDGFEGDPSFVRQHHACAPFSKARSAIANVYQWRMENTTDVGEKARYAAAADLACRQAFALCPYSPEAASRYAHFLMGRGQKADARLVARTAAGIKPDSEFNQELQDLRRELEEGE